MVTFGVWGKDSHVSNNIEINELSKNEHVITFVIKNPKGEKSINLLFILTSSVSPNLQKCYFGESLQFPL